MNNTEFKLFTLSKLKNVGPKTLFALSLNKIFNELPVEHCGCLDKRVENALKEEGALQRASDLVAHDLYLAEKNNTIIVSALSKLYPSLLKDIPDRPFFVYAKGHIEPLSTQKSIAIIGTRSPTSHGELISERVTSFFIEQGWGVVSGLALGCDTLAHKTALSLGGFTAAILAHGLQTIAPKQNQRLADDIIANNGVLISEYPFDTPPSPHLFVRRDRIQAALSLGVVLIQSSITGGSLHASRSALAYKRILAVISPTSEDFKNNSEKVLANTILCGSNGSEKMSILKCDNGSLSNIIQVYSKNDYKHLVSRLVENFKAHQNSRYFS